MTERQLKYRWQRNGNLSHDFTCWDGQQNIGRVYLHKTGPHKLWTWFLSSEDGLSFLPAQGAAVDKMEACRHLEAAYDAAVATNDEKTPQPKPRG